MQEVRSGKACQTLGWCSPDPPEEVGNFLVISPVFLLRSLVFVPALRAASSAFEFHRNAAFNLFLFPLIPIPPL